MQTAIRFKILDRDNFTCQYCGRSAPEVKLEVDHINPVKNGGDNSSENMVTACKECNIGKRANQLTLLKKPKYIDLPSNFYGFISFDTRNIRMSDESWEELKKQKIASHLTWNKFFLKKLEELDKIEKALLLSK